MVHEPDAAGPELAGAGPHGRRSAAFRLQCWLFDLSGGDRLFRYLPPPVGGGLLRRRGRRFPFGAAVGGSSSFHVGLGERLGVRVLRPAPGVFPSACARGCSCVGRGRLRGAWFGCRRLALACRLMAASSALQPGLGRGRHGLVARARAAASGPCPLAWRAAERRASAKCKACGPLPASPAVFLRPIRRPPPAAASRNQQDRAGTTG